MSKLDRLTNMDELRRLLQEQKAGQSRSINDKEMAEALKERVKGQDHVIDDVSRLIRLQWAKEKRKRPIANLLFLGPTGTGKTELAKAMAEYLFRMKRRCCVSTAANSPGLSPRITSSGPHGLSGRGRRRQTHAANAE
jgi:replication-associated recombination protein RarA